MKNFQTFFLFILIMALTTSCEKDERGAKEILEIESIIGKWTVNGTSAFESFEFNKSGNYIVVKNSTEKSTNDQRILFGTYEIIDNYTIILSDFGSLKITRINDTSMDFSVSLPGSQYNEMMLSALKQKEMESTTRTELLCRTWKLVSLNGENVEGTGDELTVLFSKAGTYFVTWHDGDSDLRHWKWKNATEKEIFYSWGEPVVWDEERKAEIIELTEDILRIRQTFSENEQLLYLLKPLDNTKSMSKSSIKYTEGRIKKGFLKR